MLGRPPLRLTALFAPLLLTAPAGAQLTLSFDGGVLGSSVDYTLDSGPPAAAYLILPSFQTGPTRLATFDPNDPRVLDIGVDLLGFAAGGTLGPTGEGGATYPLPALPALAGLPLYAQAVSLPGATTVVDQISNRTSFALGSTGDVFPALGPDVVRRMFHTSTPLKDGRVLTLGGQVVGVGLPALTGASSLFDPEQQTFGPGGVDLPQPRTRHHTVTLDDGRLLVIGGIDQTGVTASCVFVDPFGGSVSQAPPMATARVMHTATKLADGRVLVAGGSAGFTLSHPIGHPASTNSAIATTELFDPLTNSWSPGPNLPFPLTMPDDILLGSGKVLLIGGIRNVTGFGPDMSNDCFLFNPAVDSLALTDSLPRGRVHTGNITSASGDGLIAGGSTIDFGTGVTTVFNDAFRFSAASEQWSGLPPAPVFMRCGHLICVPDGQGGFYYIYGNGLSDLDIATGAAVYERRVLVLDGTLSSWSQLGTLSQDQMGAAMVPIDGGLRTAFIGPGQGPAAPDDPKSEILIN